MDEKKDRAFTPSAPVEEEFRRLIWEEMDRKDSGATGPKPVERMGEG